MSSSTSFNEAINNSKNFLDFSNCWTTFRQVGENSFMACFFWETAFAWNSFSSSSTLTCLMLSLQYLNFSGSFRSCWDLWSPFKTVAVQILATLEGWMRHPMFKFTRLNSFSESFCWISFWHNVVKFTYFNWFLDFYNPSLKKEPEYSRWNCRSMIG